MILHLGDRVKVEMVSGERTWAYGYVHRLDWCNRIQVLLDGGDIIVCAYRRVHKL